MKFESKKALITERWCWNEECMHWGFQRRKRKGGIDRNLTSHEWKEDLRLWTKKRQTVLESGASVEVGGTEWSHHAGPYPERLWTHTGKVSCVGWENTRCFKAICFLFKGTLIHLLLKQKSFYKANFCYCTVPPHSWQYLTFSPLPILIDSLLLPNSEYRYKNYSETFFKNTIKK